MLWLGWERVAGSGRLGAALHTPQGGMLPRRYRDASSDAKMIFYAQLPLHLQATKTMSRSNSTSIFHRNDRVEALWPSENKWYPARVCNVLAGNLFRIRFDGFTEQYDYPADQMRVLQKGEMPAPNEGGAKGGGGNQRPSAKQAAPAPAQAPISDPSSSGPRTDGANKSKRNQSDKRRADLAEHQDPVVSAQMHQAELSAAARIAELEERVQTLTANISSCEAAAASARSEAENARRDLLASQQKVSHLREQTKQQKSVAAEAIELTKWKAEICSLVSKTMEAALSKIPPCLETVAAEHQAVAAAQVDDRNSDEPVQALVSEKLRDSAPTEEQVKQALAVQQCGA